MIVAVLLLIGAVNPVAVHALEQTEIWTLYRDGESSFKQANELVQTDAQQAKALFRKTALCFERIVHEGGIENGKLFYNLGNTYFRLGDIGRAILNYRRAERFMAHDVNLQQNLNYSRSRCIDRIESKPQTKLFETLFFWHYDLSFFVRVVLFLIFFNLIWIGAGIHLFKKQSWLKAVALGCAAVSLLLATSIGIEAYQQSHTRYGVILAPEILARKGDSTTYEPSFKEPLHSGTEFKLVEARPGWLQIELADGRRCWIPDSSAEMI